jgi:hypothetical protein
LVAWASRPRRTTATPVRASGRYSLAQHGSAGCACARWPECRRHGTFAASRAARGCGFDRSLVIATCRGTHLDRSIHDRRSNGSNGPRRSNSRLHHRQAEKRSRFQGTFVHGPRSRTGLLAQLPEVSVLYATERRSPARGNHRHAVSFRYKRSNCGLRHAGESIWDCELCLGNVGYNQTNARSRSRLAPSIIGTVFEVSRHMRTFSYADVSLDAQAPKRHHEFCER